MSKIKLSLKMKVIIAFFIVSSIISIILAVFLYGVLENSLTKELKSKLTDIASLGTEMINMEDYKSLIKKMSPVFDEEESIERAMYKLNSEDDFTISYKELYDIQMSNQYQDMVTQLDKIRDSEPELIKYVYILIPTKDENISRFVCDAYMNREVIQNEVLPEDMTRIEVLRELYKTAYETDAVDMNISEDELIDKLVEAEMFEDKSEVEGLSAEDLKIYKIIEAHYNVSYDISDQPETIYGLSAYRNEITKLQTITDAIMELNKNQLDMESEIEALNELKRIIEKNNFTMEALEEAKQDELKLKLINQAINNKLNIVTDEFVPDPVYNANSIMGFSPILDSENGQFLGILGVDMSDVNLRKVLSEVATVSVFTGIGAVLISLLLSILIGTLFTKSITTLNKTVQRYANKEFHVRTPVTSNDEVGELGKSFNKMAEIIQNYNENLEKMVQDRTMELNNANKQLQKNNEDMLRELDMAKRVQQSILPTEKTLPHINNLNFGTEYKSMESIGGDLFDVIRAGKHGYGILMADVSGHGVPAALITTMVKVAFNSNTHWNAKPSEVCSKVNKEMFRFIGDLDYYLTAYYGIVNLETGEFTYTNAGHHPALVYKSQDRDIIELDTDGFFIGAFEDVNYETKSIKLERGDKILLLTDGITEARNSKGEFYGMERVIDFLKVHHHLSPKEFVKIFFQDVNEFGESRPADDDRAILFVEYLSPLEKGQHQAELKFEGGIIQAETDEKEEKHNTETQFLYKKALNFIKNENFEEAEKIFLELKKEDPNNPKILHGLGITYYKQNKLKEAHNMLQEAIKRDSQNELIMKNLNIVIKKIEKEEN